MLLRDLSPQPTRTVARSCLHVAVPEQLPDHRQGLAERQCAGREAVAYSKATEGLPPLDQRSHGFEEVPVSDGGKAVGAVFSGPIGADDEVFQQSEGGDRGLELGVGLGAGGGLRTSSGAKARRESGISGMSGSALVAMLFMPVSMEGCNGGAGTALSSRVASAPEQQPSGSGRGSDQAAGVVIARGSVRRGSKRMGAARELACTLRPSSCTGGCRSPALQGRARLTRGRVDDPTGRRAQVGKDV